jgi:hypothetical protein
VPVLPDDAPWLLRLAESLFSDGTEELDTDDFFPTREELLEREARVADEARRAKSGLVTASAPFVLAIATVVAGVLSSANLQITLLVAIGGGLLIAVPTWIAAEVGGRDYANRGLVAAGVLGALKGFGLGLLVAAIGVILGGLGFSLYVLLAAVVAWFREGL